MNIEIKEYKNYNSEEILNLYNAVGWCSYTNKPEMLEHAFNNSLKILCCYHLKLRNLLYGVVSAQQFTVAHYLLGTLFANAINAYEGRNIGTIYLDGEL